MRAVRGEGRGGGLAKDSRSECLAPLAPFLGGEGR